MNVVRCHFDFHRIDEAELFSDQSQLTNDAWQDKVRSFELPQILYYIYTYILTHLHTSPGLECDPRNIDVETVYGET